MNVEKGIIFRIQKLKKYKSFVENNMYNRFNIDSKNLTCSHYRAIRFRGES